MQILTLLYFYFFVRDPRAVFKIIQLPQTTFTFYKNPERVSLLESLPFVSSLFPASQNNTVGSAPQSDQTGQASRTRRVLNKIKSKFLYINSC